jgi:hypothetical protein
VPHSPAIGAEDEISRTAILALAAGHGGSAEARDSLAQGSIVIDIFAYLNHCAGELMSQNDWRIVAKSVVKNVDISSAKSTIGNLELYLVVSTTRLLDFSYINIPFATRILDQSFHFGGSLTVCNLRFHHSV